MGEYHGLCSCLLCYSQVVILYSLVVEFRQFGGPAQPSRISFCAAAYRPIVFKPPLLNSAYILQTHGHD